MNRKEKPSLTERIVVGAGIGAGTLMAGTILVGTALMASRMEEPNPNHLYLAGKPAKVLSYEFRNTQTGPVDDIPATLNMVLEVDGRIVGASKSEPLAAKTGYERLISQERMPGDDYPSVLIESGYVDRTNASPSDTLKVKGFTFSVPSKEADAYK